MEKLFKAFDGKIFNDEEECLLYEMKSKIDEFKGKVVGLNANFKNIEIDANNLNIFFETADYIFVADEGTAEFLDELFFEDYGYHFGKGLNIYDKERYCFVNSSISDFTTTIKKEIEEKQKTINLFLKISNELAI